MEDSCDVSKRKRLVKKSRGKRGYRRIFEDVTPVIKIFDAKPTLTLDAIDYLDFIGKSYEEWVNEDAVQIVHDNEEKKVKKWIKSYEHEDPRFHWLKNRVMDYFNIKTPQTFLQMAHRSNKKNLKKILHFIQRPVRKKNVHKNLWFYIVKHTLDISQMVEVEWETEIIEDNSATNLKNKGGKLVNSDSSDNSSVMSKVTIKSKKKKVIEKPPSPKFDQHVAQIPVNYSKEIAKIHVHCARRPVGRIIKVNFLGFSRVPNKRVIPYFQESECDLQLPNYIKEMKIGRITKPDEKVFLLQCLENRIKIRTFDNIFRPQVGENMRNNLINSYLKVDFRQQWIKEKLLNYFEIQEPREFYKMCSRHKGLARNRILQFINSKCDPLDKNSYHQILFFYNNSYSKTYYKLVKTTIEKEELEPFIEIEKPPEENTIGEQLSGVRQTVSKNSQKKSKAKEKAKRKKKMTKKKKMKIIRIKHDVAILTKFQKDVNQLHLHHGPILSKSVEWRDKSKVLCLIKKNNPYQSIPYFDTYEEALSEMPKYVSVLNFQMNSVLSSFFHTIDLCHDFMNKHISEPIFPPLLDKYFGSSITLPNSIVERDSSVKTNLFKIPFPWKQVVNGPLRFENYICEQRSWPGKSEDNNHLETKKFKIKNKPEAFNVYKATESRKELRYSHEIPMENKLPQRFISIQWLLALKQIYYFSKINEKNLHDYLKAQKKASISALIAATGRSVHPVLRMPVFSKVIKLLKLTNIAKNIVIVKDLTTPLKSTEKKKEKNELESIKIFDRGQFKVCKKLNGNQIRNYSRLPPETLLRYISLENDVVKKLSCAENIFQMRKVKHQRILFSQTKTSLNALKIRVIRLYKYSQYPKKLCIPEWRKMLQELMNKNKNFQKASEHIFNQKDYIKKDMEFRTILFQYLRKLYWFCREKMPRTYGPFTLFHYWKLRERVTYPFIRQCFSSRTIKFMLAHYYFNNRYYYDQFNKQFPFILKVYKRAKYYCHLFKGFIYMLKNFRCCCSIDELCSVTEKFWRYIRNYWGTSHFLSYQEIFCWALSYVVKTLVGKIKAIVNIECLLRMYPLEAEKTLLEVLYLMKLWKDEFNKYFSLCTNDKGGYIQFLVLLEEDFFQNTVNVSKVCSDLMKLLKRLRNFTNVFTAGLAQSVTVPKMVYYWRERCIDSIKTITNYDIFDLENDKKWDHMQSQWHKNFKVMERQSIRLIKNVFKNIRDPALAAHYINSISEKDTSKKIYRYLLRMFENCIDKIMTDFKNRFNMYLKNRSSLHDNYIDGNEPIPTGGIMWIQRYIVVLCYHLKALLDGGKILDAIRQDKDIGIKLRVALKEFKDFVAAVELIAYTQEMYIRDFILLRSTAPNAIEIDCDDSGPLLLVNLENIPTYRLKLQSKDGGKDFLPRFDKFPSTVASIIKPRMTFKCLDESTLYQNMHDAESKGFIDKNPPEVRAYFTHLESKSIQLQERITKALKQFLKGKFNSIKLLPEIKEKRIQMNYNVCSTFLKSGKLSVSFIPVHSLKNNVSPISIFEISSSGKFLFINSPHGNLECLSSQENKIEQKLIEGIINKKHYKYGKVIVGNLFRAFSYSGFQMFNSFKRLRNSPEIVYSVLKNLHLDYNKELKQLIEDSSSETIRFHISFLLVVFLRELLHFNELDVLRNKFTLKTSSSELDMKLTISDDEDFLLTTKLYTSLNEEQLGKLIEIANEFEKIFLKESLIVKEMESITEREDYLEKNLIIDNFCDDSDSSFLKTKHSSTENKETLTDSKSSGHIEAFPEYSESTFSEKWLNISSYKYFNSYFEDLEYILDYFGVLIRMSNLIIFKDNKYITVRRHLGIAPENAGLDKNLQYDMIYTLQDRRALPLMESKRTEEDFDFLTNFIFEHQGDIIRHFTLNPQEFTMRIFGSDCYLDMRDVYLITNEKGEVDLYKYPIMLDKSVKKRVCKLSDRYYSEQNEVENFISESGSEKLDEEPTKEKRKVQLVYEPITSWNSDDSVPSDFFPQRWIDRTDKEFVPFDPYGREAAQMMVLFKKGSQDFSDLEIIEKLDDEEKKDPVRPYLKDNFLSTPKPTLTDKKNVNEISHNLASKAKNIFFEPIERNFLCYILCGTLSNDSIGKSYLTFDGGRATSKEPLTNVNKISSKRIRNWCNNLNYYNKYKMLIPFIEKVPKWITYNSNKISTRQSVRSASASHSEIPEFKNAFNKSRFTDQNIYENRLESFPTPEKFPKWATYWPLKKGEVSINSSETLDKMARSLFLRRKFILPDKIRYLNSYYKYYYYKLKRNSLRNPKTCNNFLTGWKIHPYFATQRRYRKIAQTYLQKFMRCPKSSTKYLERLFCSHSLFLLRKISRNNNLAKNIFETFERSMNSKKQKFDKFLYGIYNALQFNPKTDRLKYWFDSLDNESASLLKSICSELEERTKFPYKPRGSIPFYIPIKYIYYICNSLTKQRCLTYSGDSVTCLDQILKESNNRDTNSLSRGNNFEIKRKESTESNNITLMKSTDEEINHWKELLDKNSRGKLTLATIQKRMYDILLDTNYDKKCHFSIKMPPSFLVPYAQNRNMVHTLVNTDEDYTWKYNLEFTVLSWHYLKQSISSYNKLRQKLTTESDEDIYFMRSFLKQMDLRMLVILRSYLLYKRIPIRSKKIIEKGIYMYECTLEQLKEALNSVINPSWNFIKNCIWFEGLAYDQPFEDYLWIVMKKRREVQSNLLYINRLFYHGFKILHYVFHGDWPPGFVNNFRFYKYFEQYERKRVKYSVKNLAINTELFKQLLHDDIDENVIVDYVKNADDSTLRSSSRMMFGSYEEFQNLLWTKPGQSNNGNSFLGHPILTIMYKFGDVSFEEPIERWLFELWFHYINGYIHFPRWMAGTCEDTSMVKVISKEKFYRSSIFDEFMRYTESKEHLMKGIEHIICFLNSLNSYRNKWKIFYNLWSAKRRYKMRYNIIHEDLCLSKIDEALKYITEVIKRLKEISIISFGFIKIDLRKFINNTMIPRCEKFKSSICYGIMKRIKNYMTAFNSAFFELLDEGEDLQHFLITLENTPKAQILIRDFNIGVIYAREACEVLAHSGLMFRAPFFEHIRTMECTLHAARSRLKSVKLFTYYYQMHFNAFMDKFKAKCSAFSSKWWNKGPRNYSHDLDAGLDLLLWYRKGFRDLRLKQKQYSLVRKKLNVYIHCHYYFENAFSDYRNVETLYAYYQIYKSHYNQWIMKNWHTFKYYEILSELEPMIQSFHSLDVTIKMSPLGEEIDSLLSKVYKTIMILKVLKDKVIKERHWINLKKHTNYEINLMDPNLQLVEFFQWNLWDKSDFIDKLYLQATSEHKIILKIKKLSFASVSIKLQILPYYDDGKLIGFVLDSNDVTLDLLHVYIDEFKKLLASEYSGRFSECITSWINILSFCQEVLIEWLKVQTKLLILKPLALSGDLTDELPDVATNFAYVDKEYFKMTSVFARQRGIIPQSMKRGIVKKFYQFSETLDECLENLLNYLNTQQMLSPSFEMIDKNLIIEIKEM